MRDGGATLQGIIRFIGLIRLLTRKNFALMTAFDEVCALKFPQGDCMKQKPQSMV